MGKIEKMRAKLQEKIERLEMELKTSLGKKTSDTKEIDIASHMRKINDLQKELNQLK